MCWLGIELIKFQATKPSTNTSTSTSVVALAALSGVFALAALASAVARRTSA